MPRTTAPITDGRAFSNPRKWWLLQMAPGDVWPIVYRESEPWVVIHPRTLSGKKAQVSTFEDREAALTFLDEQPEIRRRRRAGAR